MVQAADKLWYIRDRIAGQPRQVWVFDGLAATKAGVTNPETGAGTYFKAEPGEDFFACIRRQTSWLNPDATEGRFHRASLGPGEFYPRIARPLALAVESTPWSPSILGEKAYVASSRSQLGSLTRKLETICQTVQPSKKTFDAYGHEMRNLLILAATEVEMHWRGILKANGWSGRQFSSNEYIKLIEPLKLFDYVIAFHDFPDMQPIRPFAGWSKEEPTRSLGWYDAYHGVKHNREDEFDRGTFRHAFEAVSACFALVLAQFGPTALSSELSGLVSWSTPNWRIEDMYLSRLTLDDWAPINHPDL